MKMASFPLTDFNIIEDSSVSYKRNKDVTPLMKAIDEQILLKLVQLAKELSFL